jgi:hypothetical protein
MYACLQPGHVTTVFRPAKEKQSELLMVLLQSEHLAFSIIGIMIRSFLPNEKAGCEKTVLPGETAYFTFPLFTVGLDGIFIFSI